MNEIVSWRPLLAVAIGVLAAVPILLSSRRPNLREGWTMLAGAGQLAAAASMLPATLAGTTFVTPEIPLLPGMPLAFRADPLGMLFLLLSSALWLLTSAYSIGYLRSVGSGRQTGYFAAFAVAVAAAAGIALAANPITFLIFYEILTLATWPLVAHNRTANARSGGRTYLAYTLAAGQVLLAAVVWAGAIAPGAGFAPGGFLAGTAGDGALRVLFVLFLVGVGAKAAILPLQAWLPAAMVAPTPVSALLHAVAVVKAGAFGVLRVTGFTFGPELLDGLGLALPLALLAAATILFASVKALAEDHLKRRLAWSTVSQLSYIVLGGALGAPLALAGAAFHVAAHGFMKITLFFCAGSVYAATGKERISEMGGLGRSMPVTFGAFLVGALGMAGIPLFAGFVSKWSIAVGAIQSGNAWAAVVLVASGMLNLAYYLPVLRTAFFGRAAAPEATERTERNPDPNRRRLREPTPWLWAPPAITAASAVLLGVHPDALAGFRRLAESAAEPVFQVARDAVALVVR